MRRGRTVRTIGAAVVGLLAGGTTLGVVSAGPGAGPGAGVAGADTPSFTMTCHGIPVFGTAAFEVVVHGTLPATVTASRSLTLAGYGATMTIPASFTTAGTGITLNGTVQLDLVPTDATPDPQPSTLTIPPTVLHKGSTQTVTLAGTVGAFTAGKTAGTATIDTATTALLHIDVDGAPLGTYDCTLPAEPVASTTVLAPHPSVTSVLPDSGPLAGGEPVTLHGTFLTDPTAVTFGPMDEATNVTVTTTGHVLTATEPPGPAGTVDVTVTTPLGTSPTTPTDHFTYTNAPIVTGVTPNSGPPAGGTTVTLTGLQFTGTTSVAFGSTTATSFTVTSPTTITAVDPPGQVGTVDVTATSPQGTSVTGALDRFTYSSPGYWTVARDGGVFSFGGAPFLGSMGGKSLNKPIVGMASTPTAGGYWLVASDGGVFSFGDAQFHGSMGGQPLDAPIVAMASTPTGAGYWLVAADGGVFAFGDAPYLGSMGGRTLAAPIVSMVAAPTGTGYWEIGATGTIYAFGTTGRYGSMGGKVLDAPVVGGATTADDQGNWEVASDGGIFAFGTAPFYGSMGGKPLNEPIVAMAATTDDGGYWEVASDGGIFSFGDAIFSGSMGGTHLNAPMVGMAAA